jgi:hypothetical protein
LIRGAVGGAVACLVLFGAMGPIIEVVLLSNTPVLSYLVSVALPAALMGIALKSGSLKDFAVSAGDAAAVFMLGHMLVSRMGVGTPMGSLGIGAVVVVLLYLAGLAVGTLIAFGLTIATKQRTSGEPTVADATPNTSTQEQGAR